MNEEKRRRRLIWRIIAVAGIPSGFIFLISLLYSGIFLLPCWFNQLTGLYCIGCGATRALGHLVHLRLAQALSSNLFIFIWLPLAGWELLRIWLEALLDRPFLPRLQLGRKTMIFLLVSALLFMLLRNLPWRPFSLLAP